jgi:hypothetical protein
MRATALIPLVFLTITYSAKAVAASYPEYPTTPPESHFQGTCVSDPDGTKFAEKACYTAFYPGQSGFAPSYRPPACDKSKPVVQAQKDILARTYSRAPDYMKGKLCRLTQLFVTRSSSRAPMGWGFWEGPDRLPNSKSVYVAISDRELTSKNSFMDVENQTIRELLRYPDGDGDKGMGYKGRGLVQLKTGADPDPELAVLGELAHELGHALVADANMDGIKRYHPRRRVSGPPRNACFESAFIQASWDEERFNRHLQRWVDFGNQYDNRAKNPDLKFSLERLRRDVGRGKFDVANRVIRDVYSSREFVSFAAAINALEDVAETYKYKVLADVMANQKVGIDLGGRDINVFDLLDSGVLQKKVQCLGDIGFLSGQP